MIKKENFHAKLKPLAKLVLSFSITGSLLLSMSGCYLFPTENNDPAPPLKKPPEITYDTVEAKRQPIEDKLEVLGKIMPSRRIEVNFKGWGRVTGVYVAVGDTVQKGEVMAEAELIKGDGNIEPSKITAPITGKVIYVKTSRIGASIDSNDTFVELAESTQMQAVYKGNSAAFFPVGAKVKVEINGKAYEGEVTSSPVAKNEEAGQVEVKVKDLPADILMGEPAMISYVLRKRENVLLLPSDRVYQSRGKWYVHVLEDGIRQERYVDVGIQSGAFVEITRGIKEGDKILK